MSEDWLPRRFPRLGTSEFHVTSPITTQYNCVGWAAGDDQRWWSHGDFESYYWPEGAPREGTVEAWAAAFATLGFERCEDARSEPGYVRVAIYGREGTALHAARQLPSGRWTSKLGRGHDIEHELEALAGETEYGEIAVLMRRPT